MLPHTVTVRKTDVWTFEIPSDSFLTFFFISLWKVKSLITHYLHRSEEKNRLSSRKAWWVWKRSATCPLTVQTRRILVFSLSPENVFLSMEKTSNPVFTRGGVTLRESTGRHQIPQYVADREPLCSLSRFQSSVYSIATSENLLTHSIGWVVFLCVL